MKSRPNNLKKVIIKILFGLFICYLFGLAVMFLVQEKLLFHPVKTSLEYNFSLTSSYEEKWSKIDGLSIHSLYIKQKDPKGVIVYFHGNGCNLSQCAAVADEISIKTNYNVWIVDYPGYGKSEGSIQHEDQLHQIADTIFNEALNLNIKKIIIYGRSLGTGIATRLASQHNVSGVILETPYLSIKSLALKAYPFVPSILLKYQFRSDLWIKNVKSKILILHGTRDSLIPISQAIKLSSLTQNDNLVVINEGEHDNLSQYELYWQTLNLFLEEQ